MHDGCLNVVSLIIVNINGKEMTVQCLLSIERMQIEVPNELIIIDNGSTDGSVEYLRLRFPKYKIISLDNNYGFGYANNIGAKTASGEYLLFLNNDTEIIMDFISPIITYLKAHPTVGIIGPKLLNSDRTFQLSYGKYPSILNEYKARQQQKKCLMDAAISKNNFEIVRQVDWVSGAALLIRKSLFQKLKGFDDRYFMYFEDSDLCLRARKFEYSTNWFPLVSLIHHRGKSCASTNTSILVEYRRSQFYYYKQHRPIGERRILKFYMLIKYFIIGLKRKNRVLSKEILKIIVQS